jgi:hypothetical protein
MWGEEQRIMDKYVLAKVFRICHIGEAKANQAKMFNAKVALAEITDKVPDTYNTNEGWIMKKMRLEYVNKIVAIVYSQLVKELIKWEKCRKNMIEGTNKRGKKGCMPFYHSP